MSIVAKSTENFAQAEKLKNLGIKFVNKDVNKAPADSNVHLVVGKDASDPKILKNMSESVMDGGFVLLEEVSSKLNEKTVKSLGLEIVASQQTDEYKYTLIRKVKYHQLLLITYKYVYVLSNGN